MECGHHDRPSTGIYTLIISTVSPFRSPNYQVYTSHQPYLPVIALDIKPKSFSERHTHCHRGSRFEMLFPTLILGLPKILLLLQPATAETVISNTILPPPELFNVRLQF
jgi:hypothetical protein